MMVSLPAKWARKYGLQKGQELDLEEDGPRLVLEAEGKRETESLRLKIDDPKKFMTRTIQVPFREGYDELTVEFSDVRVVKELEKTLEKLLGFEIVDQTANSCTMKSFAVMEEQDIDKLIRRLFRLILTMADDSAAALSKGETSKLRSISDIERTVERFAQFTMRLINKNMGAKPRETTFQFITVWSLEQISDNFARFCNSAAEPKMHIKKETANIYRKIVGFYRGLYEVYYKRDPESIMALRSQIPKLRKECQSLMNSSEAEPIACMLLILENTVELSYMLV